MTISATIVLPLANITEIFLSWIEKKATNLPRWLPVPRIIVPAYSYRCEWEKCIPMLNCQLMHIYEYFSTLKIQVGIIRMLVSFGLWYLVPLMWIAYSSGNRDTSKQWRTLTLQPIMRHVIKSESNHVVIWKPYISYSACDHKVRKKWIDVGWGNDAWP